MFTKRKGMAAGSRGPPPTVPGAPFGSGSQPNFQQGYGNNGPGQYGPGQTGGNFPVQAQTGGNFSQSHPSHPPGIAATVMGAPGMMVTTGDRKSVV